MHIKTYTGEALFILGTAKILVTYGEIAQKLQVYVVAGRGPNIMERDWLGSFNLIVGVINSFLTPAGFQEILDKYVSVFQQTWYFKGCKGQVINKARCSTTVL